MAHSVAGNVCMIPGTGSPIENISTQTSEVMSVAVDNFVEEEPKK